MALRCPMLLYACLAGSAKQMTRTPNYRTSLRLQNSPVFYYQQALRQMSYFLVEPRYAGSDELLASSIILSTYVYPVTTSSCSGKTIKILMTYGRYEILDVAGESFGSHLEGVASLIRSFGINGDETGIRGATYRTWYRHEVWVTFHTGRQMFLDENYWKPQPLDSYSRLSMRDIANRVLFIFGQCISCHVSCSKGNNQSEEWFQKRATELKRSLRDFDERLPQSMETYYFQQPSAENAATQGRPNSRQFGSCTRKAVRNASSSFNLP